MKRQIIFSFIITLIGLSSMAQEKPGWIFNKPTPTNNSYLYDVEWGDGKTPKEAENEAFAKVFRYAAMQVGQPFESSEINAALQSGKDYSVIAAQYNIPINKVCEFSENVGGQYKVYILCQVAAAGNVMAQWSNFSDCDRQHVDGIAVLKSALLPGLGQFHKGQNVKGVCFLTGEAVCVTAIVIGQSMRKTNINKMNNTTSVNAKKAYANKANTYTTIRNIGIGAAAAVYVWNVLDAIIAKSNHQYLSYGSPVNLTPVVTDESVALSLNINF